MSRIHPDAEIAAMSLLPDNGDIIVSLYKYAHNHQKIIDIKIVPDGITQGGLVFSHHQKTSFLSKQDIYNLQPISNKYETLGKILSDLFY